VDIFEYLRQHSISFQLISHPPVFTSTEAALHLQGAPGTPTKNLFIRNKKGDIHLLVVVPEDKTVDLTALGNLLALGRLGFASPERLERFLGVKPGAVTLLGLLHDHERKVRVVIDQAIWSAADIHCHPLVNDTTLVIPQLGIRSFLNSLGITPAIIEVPSLGG
jgi:Ala-tRNA(Pro) deacylase